MSNSFAGSDISLQYATELLDCFRIFQYVHILEEKNHESYVIAKINSTI